MKTKIKTFMIVIELFLSIIITTGCFPDVDNTSISNQIITDPEYTDSIEEFKEESIAIPQHIYYETDNLVINADVSFADGLDLNSELSSISLKYRNWNHEYVISELFKDREITNTRTSENSTPDDLIYTYTFDDNSSLYFTNGSVRYITEYSEKFQYSFYFDYYKNFLSENTLSEIFSEPEIDGLDKNEAVSKSNKVISALKINDITGEPLVYSMDAETINSIQDEKNAKDKYGNEPDRFTYDQEAYVIIYPILYNNLPSLQFRATGINENYYGSAAYVVYGRNGVINFKVSEIYDVNLIIDKKQIYSPVKAKDDLIQYFNSIITDSKLNISLIKLGYITRSSYSIKNELTIQGDMVLEPVWMIYGQFDNDSSPSNPKEKLSSDYFSLISALTGEKLIGG